MNVRIKEKSLLAWVAAKVLHADKVAIVFGNTIHLWNTGKKEFLDNQPWVKHELAHVAQYKQYGFALFIFLYLWETIKNGYYKNRFEAEARSQEEEPLNHIEFN